MTPEDVRKEAGNIVALLNLGDGTAKIPNTSREIVREVLRALLARDRRQMAERLKAEILEGLECCNGCDTWLLSKAEEMEKK